MLIVPQPYFMKNKDWYFFDKSTFTCKLTNKAPKKAIDSYNEFYKILNKDFITDKDAK